MNPIAHSFVARTGEQLATVVDLEVPVNEMVRVGFRAGRSPSRLGNLTRYARPLG